MRRSRLLALLAFVALTLSACDDYYHHYDPIRGEIALADRRLTPGDVAIHDVAQVCRPYSASSRRDVSPYLKHLIKERYGIPRDKSRQYVIDHLISLNLGGSNATTNLWPQDAEQARRKDLVELELHEAVCNRLMPLDVAQARIATDWTTAFPDGMYAKLSPASKRWLWLKMQPLVVGGDLAEGHDSGDDR